MKRSLVLLLLSCLLLAGATSCSKRYKVYIESDTCWDGLVNNDQSIYGCGNSTYKVIGKLSCVKLQKNGVEGYLRVRIDGQSWSETTESHGITQACN